MSNHVVEILQAKWCQALEILPDLANVRIYFEFGSSSHFESSRGFATMRTDGVEFVLNLSTKLIDQCEDRVTAVLCHEIGHVVDFSNNAVWEDLPLTPERRADAIAQKLFGIVIGYDNDDVQTLTSGETPRPERLGL